MHRIRVLVECKTLFRVSLFLACTNYTPQYRFRGGVGGTSRHSEPPHLETVRERSIRREHEKVDVTCPANHIFVKTEPLTTQSV